MTSASTSSDGLSICRRADLDVPNLSVPNVKNGAFENWTKLKTGISFSLLSSSPRMGLKSRNPLRVDVVVSDIFQIGGLRNTDDKTKKKK